FRRHDDLAFNILALSYAEKVAIVRNNVYYYVLGRDGQDVSATDERLFIHFRIFEYLFSRLKNNLNEKNYHKYFLITMYGHHKWALERIDRRLKMKYRIGMAAQLFQSKGRLNLRKRYQLLRRRFRNDKREVTILLFLYLFYGQRPMPTDM